MKRLCGIAGVALVVGCTSVPAPPSAPSAAGRPVSDGWRPGEMVMPAQPGTVISLPASRKGVSPGGHPYTIYPDGSAGVDTGPGAADGWSIDCGKDKMNDRRNCKLTSYDAHLILLYDFGSSPRWVCILGHDFPGRHGQIRAGSREAVNTDSEGCVSGSFVTQLAAESTVVTRRYKWPYDYSSDHSASLAGLSDAMDLISFIRTNIDRLSF